jgi:hypothetical protein
MELGAGLSEQGAGEAAQPARFPDHDQRLTGQLAELDWTVRDGDGGRCSTGPVMNGFGSDQAAGAAVGSGDSRHKDEVELAIEEGAAEVGEVVFGEHEHDRPMTGRFEGASDQSRLDQRRDPDAQWLRVDTGHGAGLGEHGFHARQDRVHVWQHPQSQRGGADARGGAGEQLTAQNTFQCGDTVGKGRLGNPEGCSGAGKRTQVSGGTQVIQLRDLHGVAIHLGYIGHAQTTSSRPEAALSASHTERHAVRCVAHG